MNLLLVWLFALAPAGATVDHVSVMEVNHLHDQTGRLVFSQLILYDWHPQRQWHHVVDWRLLPKGEQTYVLRDWSSDHYKLLLLEGRMVRRIVAKQTVETHTLVDPELAERDRMPREERRGLSNPTRSIRKLLEGIWR